MTYLHVTATLGDYDAWKAEFDRLHEERAKHGGRNYQLFQSSDDPNRIAVLIEFDDEVSARSWNDYLQLDEGKAAPDMTDVEVTYLDMVEHVRLPTA
ncbi:antibiotic biosynthesis monooxygenase [Halorarius litoreus]|uniref:antibiotic biosynthesis monooxygenase n=1 Tax=Halorarius litoreus TaxID=2962676 RepID=UPI0020CDE923|nr:antibiotic biosynthesis monooxygenase [Halorarius litoreus]